MRAKIHVHTLYAFAKIYIFYIYTHSYTLHRHGIHTHTRTYVIIYMYTHVYIHAWAIMGITREEITPWGPLAKSLIRLAIFRGLWTLRQHSALEGDYSKYQHSSFHQEQFIRRHCSFKDFYRHSSYSCCDAFISELSLTPARNLKIISSAIHSATFP